MTSKIPVPTLVRIDYLTPAGWVQGEVQNLLHPERVVERYREKGKFARVTAYDGALKPTGRVWVADDVPEDPSILVPSDTRVPKLPEPDKTCPLCDTEHLKPWDGSCLL